jgi:hypothetical protein
MACILGIIEVVVFSNTAAAAAFSLAACGRSLPAAAVAFPLCQAAAAWMIETQRTIFNV